MQTTRGKTIISAFFSLMLLAGSSISQDLTQATRDTFPGVPGVTQQPNPEWCWAAASKSLCHYYNKSFNLSLKDVAKIFTTSPSQCPSPSELGGILKKIIETNCPGTTAEYKSGALSIADVKKEIDAKRAFLYVIKWNASGYHCNTISGYKGGYDENGGGSFQVYAMDPEGGGKRWISYTANGMNKGQGSFGSLVITKCNTGIADQQQSLLQTQPFTVVANQMNTSMINVSISGLDRGIVDMKFFDSKGSCLYQTEKSIQSNVTLFSVPFTASTGHYFVLCKALNNATSMQTKNNFFIVK